jgi:hypothetical protein
MKRTKYDTVNGGASEITHKGYRIRRVLGRWDTKKYNPPYWSLDGEPKGVHSSMWDKTRFYSLDEFKTWVNEREIKRSQKCNLHKFINEE